MEAKIRKHQTTLICSGLAVIAFGAWSIVRACLVLLFNMAQLWEIVEDGLSANELQISAGTILTVTLALIFTVLLLDLAFRTYVGLSALAEGSGKHRRGKYIVLSAFVLTVTLLADIALFLSSAREALTVKVFATLFIEISSNIAYLEIIRSSLALRRYSRSGNKDRGEDYAA